MNKSLHWDDLPTDRREKRTPRLLAAAMLRLGSSILNRVARRLAAAERRRNARYYGEILEFYAEAGAPEGALYANGVLIGYLDGVRRL